MESEAGKESEKTNKFQNKQQMNSSTSKVMGRMNDEGNVTTPSPSLDIQQKNPLLIDLVLESTLAHLSLKDLLSCRLVCRTWNRISLPKVKPGCPELIFSVKGLIKPRRGHARRSQGQSANYFLPTMKKSLSIPCGKFQLQLERSNPDLEPFQKVINAFSNEITSLHLAPTQMHRSRFGEPDPHCPDTNKAIFQNWLNQLKNLTKLTITNFDFGVTSCSSFFEPGFKLNLDNLREFHFFVVGKEGKPSSGFFDGFFKAAQNLETVRFGIKRFLEEPYFRLKRWDHNVFDEMDLEEGEDRMESFLCASDFEFAEEKVSEGLNVVLNSFLNHGKLSGIKFMSFNNLNSVNFDTIVDIGKNGLKLESFQVHGGGFELIDIYQFLETQKDTLKILEISEGGTFPGTLRLGIPSEMKELERLSICNNGPLEIKMNEPICYSSRFPKLRELHVEGGHWRRFNRQDVGILDIFLSKMKNLVGCETLKKLRMYFTLSDDKPRIQEDKILRRVSRIFPEMTICVEIDRDEYDGEFLFYLEGAETTDMTLKITGVGN